MNKIIITGHGKYAEGLYSSLSMLSGNLENVIAINFEKSDTEDILLKKYQDVINNEDSYIFACDLLGGTPYKMSAKTAYDNDNVKVVTGANLGGIIDTNFKMKNLSLEDATNNLLEASKKNLTIFEIKQEENNNGEGI